MTNRKKQQNKSKTSIPKQEAGKRPVFAEHEKRFPYNPQTSFDRDRIEAIRELVAGDQFSRQGVEPFSRQGVEPVSQPMETLAIQTANKTPDLAIQTAAPSNELTAKIEKPSNLLTAKYQESYKKRNLTKTTLRMDRDIHLQIKRFALDTGIDFQEFFHYLAVWYFNPLATNKTQVFEGHLAVKPSHDDMMTFKTHEDIIMRYQECTLQKWTRRDDRDGLRYNAVDSKLVDIAIISTVEKKLRGNTAKQPIKSFNYFTQEIDLLLEQQRCGELPAALDEYHKYVLSTWEKRIRKIRDEKWGKA